MNQNTYIIRSQTGIQRKLDRAFALLKAERYRTTHVTAKRMTPFSR